MKISGYSLIEVMIALVVLSFGLLGMALLQTSALRSGQSANYRSQATILAYDIADMIRANRMQAAGYDLINANDFGTVDGRTGVCALGAEPNAIRWQADKDAWLCAVARSLPGAQGDVTVVAGSTGKAGTITIDLNWINDRSVDQNATVDPNRPRLGNIKIVTGI